jgi:hypothetical protein
VRNHTGKICFLPLEAAQTSQFPGTRGVPNWDNLQGEGLDEAFRIILSDVRGDGGICSYHDTAAGDGRDDHTTAGSSSDYIACTGAPAASPAVPYTVATVDGTVGSPTIMLGSDCAGAVALAKSSGFWIRRINDSPTTLVFIMLNTKDEG